MMRLRALPDHAGDALVAPSDEAMAVAVAPGGNPLLDAALDPAGALAEPIGRLRGALAGARRADGEPARLVAIAGIDVPDEAALVAAALAVSTARGGHETLLVDARLGSPVLHRLFGCDNDAGLTSPVPPRQLGATIRATGEPRLSLLPAGPATEDDAILDGARLFGLLRPFGDRVESMLVLGDGEPGLIAGTSEGFDGAVLVVRRDVSSARRLKAAAAALAERGVRLLGVVRVG